MKNNRPKISPGLTTWDRWLEILSIIFLIILLVLPAYFYSKLPESIPKHFNSAGEPDAFGDKITIWIVPVTGLILFIVLTILNRFPHTFNYLVRVTENNANVQYTLATRMVRVIKFLITAEFAYLTYHTIQTGLGNAAGLGAYFLFTTLVLTVGTLSVYIFLMLKNR